MASIVLGVVAFVGGGCFCVVVLITVLVVVVILVDFLVFWLVGGDGGGGGGCGHKRCKTFLYFSSSFPTAWTPGLTVSYKSQFPETTFTHVSWAGTNKTVPGSVFVGSII